MSPIYEDENTTRDQLFELRKKNRCKQCGGMLNVFLDMVTHNAYLACNTDQSHEGIEREAPPPFEPNIITRREDMVEELGEKKANALDKYVGVATLSREQALEIFGLFWPEAPYNDRLKAAIICHQYGLNPLLKHIALIRFKKYNRNREVVGETWAVVQEIASTRIIAHRKHRYSFLDLSPRRMTDDEQMKVNGELDKSRVWAITLIKDLDTGAEFSGVGSWPLDEEPYGAEKGNTKLNMAKIRSERNALDRAFPAELPQGVEVIADNLLEGEFTELAKTTSSKTEGGGESDVRPDAAGAAVEGESAADSPPTKDKTQKPAGAPPTKPQRNPATIKNFGDLYTACKEDWPDEFNTRQAVWKELGVSSQEQLTELPAELYKKIATVRS